MAIETLAEEVVNEVATNLEEAAEVTRSLNTAGLSYLAVGLGLGAAVGFYFGYKFNRQKIQAEAYKEAEAEVAQMRQIYLEKASEVTSARLEGAVLTEKPPIEQVVERLGYGQPIPERERPLPAPVPIHEEVLIVEDLPADILDDLPENPVGTSKSANAGWNYQRELKTRTPDAPYVIHQNEYEHSEPNYTKAEFVFYDLDEILVDTEDEQPLNMDTVGKDNLKFGHGSDDSEVVYVRNDEFETDMQVTRINASFEEDIVGMQGLRDDDDDDDDGDDDADDS